jgi:hypothetical protein
MTVVAIAVAATVDAARGGDPALRLCLEGVWESRAIGLVRLGLPHILQARGLTFVRNAAAKDAVHRWVPAQFMRTTRPLRT